MSDPGLRFTLTWGDMTLELKGDAASVLRELDSLKASGIGRLADFFALRTSALIAPAPQPSPPPAPTPQPSPTRTSQPSPPPTPTPQPLPSPTPHGDFFRFAFTSWQFPNTLSEAQLIAANIDNDSQNRPDNAFGNIVVMLGQQNFDLAAPVPLGAEAGSAAPLLRVQTIDPAMRDDAGASAVVMSGQRADAESVFTLDPTVEPASFFGPLIGGRFVSEPRFGPVAPLDVTIPGPLAIQFRLMAARIDFTATAIDAIEGALQGAIAADEFRDAFLSSLARMIANQVAIHPESEVTATLLALFGGNAAPGTITSVDQWREALEQSDLLRSVLQPDVVVDGRPAVSFAIRFRASSASF